MFMRFTLPSACCASSLTRGGAFKVAAAAKARGIEITTLLCTHKHWDHSGGNEAMKKMVGFSAVPFCPGGYIG